MYYSLSTHHHWTVRMVYNVVTDRAEDGPPHQPQASCAHHDHASLLVLCCLTDEFAYMLVEV